jgi:hypothetical protein
VGQDGMRLEERNTREAAAALQQEPAMRLQDPKGEPNTQEPKERETNKRKGERETRGHAWRDGGDAERDRRVEQDKRTRDGAAGQESPAAGQESAVPPPAGGGASATGAGNRVSAARLENANSLARNGEAAISLLQTGEWEWSAGGGSSGSSAVGGCGLYVLVCVCALAGAAVVLARRRRR